MPATYAYDAADRLRRGTEVTGTTTYTFDANGNQRSVRLSSGDVTTMSWRYENQLAEIEEPDGDLVTYSYAPAGWPGLERVFE